MTMMHRLLPLLVFLPVTYALSTPSSRATESIPSIDDLPPLTRTILPIPSSQCSDTISYLQKTTNTRLVGLRELQLACASWEESFQSNLGVESAIDKISTVSPQTQLVRWNVTWVPPTSAWLEVLGNAWPGVEVAPTSYNHLSGKVSTFSWNAVFCTFTDAFVTGKLRIPLACIQGTSELTLGATTTDKKLVVSISEDLDYAQDLQRGVLLNRRCAADLRVFLETGRRMKANNQNEDWDDTVAKALPWSSVPGSNSLDVDAIEEGDGPVIVFLGIVALVLLGFANIIGPQLIGQSLFGPPNYVVRPEDLNSIY
jgi:hypothetical protein